MMNLGVEKARETMNKNIGGPFGAVILDKDLNVIACASNSVLGDCDPTAHAEINAIRIAGKKLNTHDLSGCTLYATGYPCPMCLSAIIWANIKKVYYGCTKEDADKIGFRDDFIYKFIQDGANDIEILELKQKDRDICIKLFEEYKNNNKKMY